MYLISIAILHISVKIWVAKYVHEIILVKSFGHYINVMVERKMYLNAILLAHRANDSEAMMLHFV